MAHKKYVGTDWSETLLTNTKLRSEILWVPEVHVNHSQGVRLGMSVVAGHAGAPLP